MDIENNLEVAKVLTQDNKIIGIETNTGRTIKKEYVMCSWQRRFHLFSGELKRLNLSLAVNPVDFGVRVEVPAVTLEEIIDKVCESKLVYYSRSFDDKVRTFCMNPRGEVVMENNGGGGNS